MRDAPDSTCFRINNNLWNVERTFSIFKSKIEIRPMFHFTRRRIEAHVCICFVALKVYKVMERLLKLSEIRMSVDKILAPCTNNRNNTDKIPSKQGDH